MTEARSSEANAEAKQSERVDSRISFRWMSTACGGGRSSYMRRLSMPCRLPASLRPRTIAGFVVSAHVRGVSEACLQCAWCATRAVPALCLGLTTGMLRIFGTNSLPEGLVGEKVYIRGDHESRKPFFLFFQKNAHTLSDLT